MADTPPEAAYMPISHDLWVAIDKYDFTLLERRILSAVIYFTFGAGKSKSELTAEDIRYYLGAERKLRTDRIEEAITRLIGLKILFRQELSNGGRILGIQRDYAQWCDKMSPTLRDEYKYINTNNTTSMVRDKMSQAISPPERLLAYAQLTSEFKYGISAWRAERKQARLLYQEVLTRVRSGEDAYNLICDYIDQDEWMRLNVKFPFTYMSSRFEAWRSQIPRKPREIGEAEQALGRRYRYNVRNKQWEPVVARKEVT